MVRGPAARGGQAFVGVEATQSWLRRRAPGADDDGDRTPKVLIISYETFRLYADVLQSKPIGLVLCDEVRPARPPGPPPRGPPT